MEDTARMTYTKNLIAAYKECRELLEASRKQVDETTRLLEHLNARKLDYPRCARVNYTESDSDISDSPLALFVRLLKPTQKGS